MKDFIVASGIVLSVMSIAIWGVYKMDNWGCLSAYESYQPQYGFWTGCRVMRNGKLTPVDIIREIN